MNKLVLYVVLAGCVHIFKRKYGGSILRLLASVSALIKNDFSSFLLLKVLKL